MNKKIVENPLKILDFGLTPEDLDYKVLRDTVNMLVEFEWNFDESGLKDRMIEVFGGSFGQHFYEKFDGNIFKLYSSMNNDNRELLLKVVAMDVDSRRNQDTTFEYHGIQTLPMDLSTPEGKGSLFASRDTLDEAVNEGFEASPISTGVLLQTMMEHCSISYRRGSGKEVS
tara:strand:- start:2692 stop:3204 length:513 start_codon:yes stop_codon:yes gene_type:complete